MTTISSVHDSVHQVFRQGSAWHFFCSMRHWPGLQNCSQVASLPRVTLEGRLQGKNLFLSPLTQLGPLDNTAGSQERVSRGAKLEASDEGPAVNVISHPSTALSWLNPDKRLIQGEEFKGRKIDPVSQLDE